MIIFKSEQLDYLLRNPSKVTGDVHLNVKSENPQYRIQWMKLPGDELDNTLEHFTFYVRIHDHHLEYNVLSVTNKLKSGAIRLSDLSYDFNQFITPAKLLFFPNDTNQCFIPYNNEPVTLEDAFYFHSYIYFQQECQLIYVDETGQATLIALRDHDSFLKNAAPLITSSTVTFLNEQTFKDLIINQGAPYPIVLAHLNECLPEIIRFTHQRNHTLDMQNERQKILELLSIPRSFTLHLEFSHVLTPDELRNLTDVLVSGQCQPNLSLHFRHFNYMVQYQRDPRIYTDELTKLLRSTSRPEALQLSFIKATQSKVFIQTLSSCFKYPSSLEKSIDIYYLGNPRLSTEEQSLERRNPCSIDDPIDDLLRVIRRNSNRSKLKLDLGQGSPAHKMEMQLLFSDPNETNNVLLTEWLKLHLKKHYILSKQPSPVRGLFWKCQVRSALKDLMYRLDTCTLDLSIILDRWETRHRETISLPSMTNHPTSVFLEETITFCRQLMQPCSEKLTSLEITSNV